MHIKQKGFTLIEVLVSFVILAIVMSAVVSVIAQNSSRVIRIEQKAQSLNELENAMSVVSHAVKSRNISDGLVLSGKGMENYSWQAMVSPLHEPTTRSEPGLMLCKVRMLIFNNKNTLINIETILPAK